MKLANILKQVVTDHLKEKDIKIIPHKDYTWIALENGTVVYKIPAKHRIFNSNVGQVVKAPLIEQMEKRTDFVPAHKTIMRESSDGKTMIQKIENSKNHTWIDSKKLKKFEPDCTFEIVNSMVPVRVLENGETVGYIAQVVHAEED